MNVDFKKCTRWELQLKFYLGQNEEHSLEDSISANSEELFQSSSGEGGQHYMRFS